MHAVTYGDQRDQMMARHKANHIQVAYANDADAADRAMLAKAAMAEAMGMDVYVCGTRKDGSRGIDRGSRGPLSLAATAGATRTEIRGA